MMLGNKGPGVAVEGSALEVASPFKTSTYKRRIGEKTSEKPRVYCHYCDKPHPLVKRVGSYTKNL